MELKDNTDDTPSNHITPPNHTPPSIDTNLAHTLHNLILSTPASTTHPSVHSPKQLCDSTGQSSGIQLHPSTQHPHQHLNITGYLSHLSSSHCNKPPTNQKPLATLEVNGNYDSGLNMPGTPVNCNCPPDATKAGPENLEENNPETLGNEVPYVVTDGLLKDLSSCQTCDGKSVTFQIGQSDRDALPSDVSNQRCAGRKNTGGSFDGALERIVEDQIYSNHSHTAGVHEHSTHSDSQNSSDVVSNGHDSSLTLTEQTGDEVIKDEECCSQANLSQNASTGANGSMPTSSDHQSSEFKSSIDNKPLDSRSLSLPLPFRFLKNSSPSKDRNLSVKLPLSHAGPVAGPVPAQRGRPAPRQSWLLRLFESKMFSIDIAVQYLYNSKEPGVQTYIGK